MDRILGRFQPHAYAALRIVAGFLFLCHGLQKVSGPFGGIAVLGAPPGLAFPFLAAGVIETVTGALIVLGLGTSWAAFLASGEMAVAYFTVHQRLALFPIVNHGELAVLYSWIFLFIATRGSGLWSLDGLRGRSPAPRAA